METRKVIKFIRTSDGCIQPPKQEQQLSKPVGFTGQKIEYLNALGRLIKFKLRRKST